MTPCDIAIFRELHCADSSPTSRFRSAPVFTMHSDVHPWVSGQAVCRSGGTRTLGHAACPRPGAPPSNGAGHELATSTCQRQRRGDGCVSSGLGVVGPAGAAGVANGTPVDTGIHVERLVALLHIQCAETQHSTQDAPPGGAASAGTVLALLCNTRVLRNPSGSPDIASTVTPTTPASPDGVRPGETHASMPPLPLP